MKLFEKGRKHCEKRRKCCLPFSSFAGTVLLFQCYFSYTVAASAPIHAFLELILPVHRKVSSNRENVYYQLHLNLF